MESQNFDNDQDLIDAVGDFDGPIYDYYISAPLSSSSANIPTGETRKGNSNNTAKDNDMFGWNSKNQYQPEPFIVDLHQAPRFGHSNRIGMLASQNRQEQLDYASGLKQFTLFIVLPFFFWGLILLWLKYKGKKAVGCAAGGYVLDVYKLSKEGVRRRVRRQYLLRNWRIQTTFLITGLLFPIATALLIKNGLSQLETSWDEMMEMATDVDSLFFRGLGIVERISKGYEGIKEFDQWHQLSLDIPHSKEASLSSNSPTIVYPWCPNVNDNANLTITHVDDHSVAQFNAILAEAVNQLDFIAVFLQEKVPMDSVGLIAATNATEHVEMAIEWTKSHDWLLKFLLMMVNVLSMLMILASYLVYQISPIIHIPSRFYLAWIIVPFWAALCVLIVIVTAVLGIATLVNADFCAGGPAPGSPQGALEDAILSNRLGTLDRAQGQGLLVYETFMYYSNGCLDDFPLAYLDEFYPTITRAVETVELLTAAIKLNDTETINILGDYCGADLSNLPSSLHELSSNIEILESSFSDMVDITACHNVSPLVRRLTHGDICTNSAFGLAWIWSCMFSLCVLGFTMLSTRAALFSTVITRRNRRENRRYQKNNHKQRRLKPSYVAKEFEEYRQFMSDYFHDTDEWVMIPIKKLVAGETLEIEIGSQLMRPPTFDTENTSPTSDEGMGFSIGDEDYSPSENKNILADTLGEDGVGNKNHEVDTGFYVDSDNEGESDEDAEDVSYYSGSSDESTDGDDNDSDFDDDVSALASMMSFSNTVLSDAKSLARSAIKTVRALPSLLGINKESNSFEEEDDNDVLFNDGVPESPYSHRIGDGNLPKSTSPHSNSFEDDPWHTPPSQIIPLYPNSQVLSGSSLIPKAPHKPFQFLGRTEGHDQKQSTPCRKSTLSSSSDEQCSLLPRQLEMSPLLSPASKANSKFAEQRAQMTSAYEMSHPKGKSIISSCKQAINSRSTFVAPKNQGSLRTSQHHHKRQNQRGKKSDTSWIRKSPA